MSDTLTLLTPNATATERALARVVGRTTALAVGPKYRALWSPATCPVGILPWLAWSLHVDEWDTNWTEQQKRDVIAASVAVHKTKGTIGALKRALAALGYEVTVDENTGEVCTFRLEFDLNQTGILGTDTFAAARRVAMANKNARSKLLAVRSSLTATAGVYGAVAHHRAQTVTVDCGTYDLSLLVEVTGGGVYQTGDTVTLIATVTGPGAITGQWSKGGADIDGETGLILEFTMTSEAQGEYTYTATNGSATMWGSDRVLWYEEYMIFAEECRLLSIPLFVDETGAIILDSVAESSTVAAVPYLTDEAGGVISSLDTESATVSATPYFLDEKDV